jgi:hypothetical protein
LKGRDSEVSAEKVLIGSGVCEVKRTLTRLSCSALDSFSWST